MRQCLYVVFAWVLLSAGPVLAGSWGNISDEEWALQPPPEQPAANAVVLFDRGRLEVTIEGICFTHHVRIKIHDAAGAEDAAEISISYRDGDKIKDLKAHTITPDGKKHKVSKKAIYTKTSGSHRIKHFAFEAIEDGAILEYKYKVTHRRFSLLEPWYFQGDMFVYESTFELMLAAGFTYSAVTRNVPIEEREPTMEEDRSSNERTYTWSVRKLPSLEEEPLVGCLVDYIAALQYQLVSYQSAYQNVTFIEGWADLGEYFSDVLKEYTRPAKKLAATVENITASETGKYKKASAIYSYVCDSVKTRADESNNYMTHDNIVKLVETGYGTSDEKNVLMVEMARLAGLDSWPILISTRDHARFDPKIYTLQQFNHLIAYVATDSGGVFVDATTEYCPFGLLPPRSVVDGGFLLDGKRSKIIEIPAIDANSRRMDVTTVQIDSEGTAHCSTTTHLCGYYTAAWGSRFERCQPDEFVENELLDRIGIDYVLVSHSFEKDSTRNRCQVTVEYILPDFATRLDENLLITPLEFSFRENPFQAESRSFPIDFTHPFVYQNVVTVHTDDAFSGIQLPEDRDLQMSGVSFKRHITSLPDGVRIESKLEIEKAVFNPVFYQRLREIFAGMAEANAEQIILARR